MKQTNAAILVFGILFLFGCTQPLAVCDEKQNASDKGTCYGNVAFNQNDVSVCNKLSETVAKDYCFASAAYLGKDSSICQRVQDSDIKQNCINQTS